MADEDDYEEPTSGGGDMVEHIQRYKDYIQGLKKGQSSGISAAFGRASDLLPSDVLEVAPPKGAGTAVAGHDLNEQVFPEGFDRAGLRAAVEGLILGCAEQLDDYIGATVMTAEGPSEVVNCFLEDGQRKFMLANLDVIDEDEFERSRQRTNDELEEEHEVEHEEEYEEENSESEAVEDVEDRSAGGSDELPEEQPDDEEVETTDQDDFLSELNAIFNLAEEDTEQDIEPEVAEPAVRPAPQMVRVDMPDSIAGVGKFGGTFESVTFGEERPFDLVVHNTAGSVLWGIHYDDLDIEQIVMSDGTQIRRAEGRHEYVMVQRANDRLHPRIYILSGVMVDPLTGNVYAEANQGGYTAAFLNNGWQIHQYRSRDSKDTFYVKEPDRPGRPGAFLEVINLALDVQSGEVTYETVDSAATVTLKSRRLSSG